jgi:hypothetical protein
MIRSAGKEFSVVANNQQQMSEDAPAGPGFGLKRPTFGLSRERVNRLELVLAMRGGGIVNVFDELADEVSSETLEAYAEELARQIKGGDMRAFTDAWTATGQRSWVSLGEVVAFTVRQAK